MTAIGIGLSLIALAWLTQVSLRYAKWLDTPAESTPNPEKTIALEQAQRFDEAATKLEKQAIEDGLEGEHYVARIVMEHAEGYRARAKKLRKGIE